MKITINGKRYDSAHCEVLGERDHYNNGTYSGTTYLLRASDGTLLIRETSNGQDILRRHGLYLYNNTHWTIDDFDYTPEQEARLAELGLITIVP